MVDLFPDSDPCFQDTVFKIRNSQGKGSKTYLKVRPKMRVFNISYKSCIIQIEAKGLAKKEEKILAEKS